AAARLARAPGLGGNPAARRGVQSVDDALSRRAPDATTTEDAMGRTLFEDLVVSRPGGTQGTLSRRLPLSIGLHAVALSGLVLVPLLTGHDLPKVESVDRL